MTKSKIKFNSPKKQAQSPRVFNSIKVDLTDSIPNDLNKPLWKKPKQTTSIGIQVF